MLYRQLYRGELVWNRKKKRNTWGLHRETRRPDADWIRTTAPALRIVSEALWTAAHERLADARSKYLRGTDGRLFGRPSSVESKYLLSGFARCARCGGSRHVRSRSHGRRRAYFYACTSYHKRGSTVCTNRLEIPMQPVDRIVLRSIADHVLDADLVETIVARAVAAARARRLNPADDLPRLRQDLHEVDSEISRYVEAIGQGADVPDVVTALKTRQARKVDLQQRIVALERRPHLGGADLSSEIRTRVEQWRELMLRHASQARQILRKILVGPIQLEPVTDTSQPGYRITGKASIPNLLAGLNAFPRMVASPICASWNQIAEWLRRLDPLRRAA